MNEKISYFIIAFSLYLLGKSVLFFASTPPVYLAFDVAIGVSLLCSHLPRVLCIPQFTLYWLQKLEYLSFGIAILSLLFMLL